MDVGSPRWLHDLTEVTKALGGAPFADRLMQLLNGVVPVDHCAVFTFSAQGRAGHLFTKSKMPAERAAGLAADYIGGYFAEDPNYQALERVRQGQAATTGIMPLDLKTGYGSIYRQHFFEKNDLIDKASMAAATDAGVVYCNFYRMGDSGSYNEEDRRRLSIVLPLITSLIASHDKIRRSLGDYGAEAVGREGAQSLVHSVIGRAVAPFDRLTVRERDVCARILLGFTSEAISLDIGIAPSSVATYRKRAYQKLGISTQNELFSLCLAAIERIG